MIQNAKCCQQGREYVRVCRFADGSVSWEAGNAMGDTIFVAFCPFCGHDLSQPIYESLEEAIASLLNSKPLDLVFDIDGVLCDNSGEYVPYADRKPYPWVAEALTALKAHGHRIICATARYMKKFDGDQGRASEYGGQELRWWLKENNIPFDDVYLGKPSGDCYFDDRGCRVDSNRGITHWVKNLIPAINEAQNRKN